MPAYLNNFTKHEPRTLKPALIFFILFLAALLLLPHSSFSQTPAQGLNPFPTNQSVPPGSQLDNNQYYNFPSQPNTNNQTNNQPNMQSGSSMAPADLELTARVRAEIAGNRNLSQKAQNISILSQDGKVILQGAVINEYERTSVIALAERAAGSGQVFSQLVVQP